MPSNTILFERDKWGNTVDQRVEFIRETARNQGYVLMAGFKDWAKDTYRATLRAGVNDDWTSINFKSVETLAQFENDYIKWYNQIGLGGQIELDF